ncbi:HAMP domain-containing sensor histidine kinase [Christiangramia sp. SM2212]|uniref:histidine kinase n=1 Tax=Christiangramia sediminicola TaxID=3073267 RepID=A0ABU1ES17_9FLAO|nr:HAMP domain-containing sensor histidine kinase [Christiangramia sp. SM2212]MDR5591187.1 HAMP domain-containing sensor histidine kinase [Christiangramia sp. SM2212]
MKKITHILKDNHQNIINIWEKEVLIHVDAAKLANKIALHDHIPNILDDIIDILERHDEIEWNIEDFKIAKIEANSLEHGRHRASSAEFTAEQIMHEYMIFHNVIIRVFNDNRIENKAVYHLLKCCIDKSMLKSIESFTKSIHEMQNKLIGTLAHDIRNPLSAARLGIEMLNLDTTPERVERVKKMTMSSVDKALNMVEGLLDSISVKAGEGMMLSFSEMNLFEDVQTVYEEAQEVYSEKIIFECEDENLNGVFDATAIRRLLENLLTNAVKYGKAEKPITLKVSKLDDQYLQLSVHNYGTPIPEDKQKEIFNFLRHSSETNKKDLQSWGIGLTLVKMVAEAHGGKVSLESSEDSGTEFTVTISRTMNEPGKHRTKLNFSQNS